MKAVEINFDGSNYIAKVGTKTIKSYSKKYVERQVKKLVGDMDTHLAAVAEKSKFSMESLSGINS